MKKRELGRSFEPEIWTPEKLNKAEFQDPRTAWAGYIFMAAIFLAGMITAAIILSL